MSRADYARGWRAERRRLGLCCECGEKVFSKTRCEAHTLRHREKSRIQRCPKQYSLTSRQSDVLKATAHGHTRGNIADALAISPKTVDAHLKAIRIRLKAKATVEAVARAVRMGII